MDFIVPAVDPLYAIGSNINVNKVKTREDARREFSAIFVSQILKEVFKGQSSMFGGEGSLGMFSDNLYNDIFLAKISSEIAGNKAFGFDRLLATGKQ